MLLVGVGITCVHIVSRKGKFVMVNIYLDSSFIHNVYISLLLFDGVFVCLFVCLFALFE